MYVVEESLTPVQVKDQGNHYFKNGHFLLAITYYKHAMESTDDPTLKLILHSNMAINYINLELYEDALDHANHALEIQADHVKSLNRKANALLYLHRFDESLEIFMALNDPKNITKVQQMRK